MPYKRKGLKGKRPYKRRPMTAGAVRKIAKQAVIKLAETKQLYKEVDEVTCSPGTTGIVIKDFMNVRRADPDDGPLPIDGAKPTREGIELKPISFSYKGWFRPRALASDGTPSKQNDNFASAIYVRVIFAMTNDQDPTIVKPDQTVGPSKDTFFIGQNGLTTSEELDYSDIYKPLNWKVTGKPLMDKVFFIPNQYGMNNTRLINFSHKFGVNEKSVYPLNTDNINDASPLRGMKMFMFSRYADDDTHLTYQNLEVSGTGIFKFKDF